MYMYRPTWGPSIKYVTLFWTNFYPLPCHTLSHISEPPPIFSSTCIHRPTYVFTGRFVLVRRVFVWKVLFGVVLVCSLFCQNTSVTTESQTSLSILGFICMKKFVLKRFLQIKAGFAD